MGRRTHSFRVRLANISCWLAGLAPCLNKGSLWILCPPCFNDTCIRGTPSRKKYLNTCTKDNVFALGYNKTPWFMLTWTNFFGKIGRGCFKEWLSHTRWSSHHFSRTPCWNFNGSKSRIGYSLDLSNCGTLWEEASALEWAFGIASWFWCKLPDILPLQWIEIATLRKAWAYSILYWNKPFNECPCPNPHSTNAHVYINVNALGNLWSITH